MVLVWNLIKSKAYNKSSYIIWSRFFFCGIISKKGVHFSWGRLSLNYGHGKHKKYSTLSKKKKKFLCLIYRLRKTLNIADLCDFMDTDQVDGYYVMHNCIYLNKSGVVTNVPTDDQLPHWVVSAMKCLARCKYFCGFFSLFVCLFVSITGTCY